MACQEDVWLLFEKVGLGHLVAEAAIRVVEVFVSKQVNIGTAFGFIHFCNLKELSDKTHKQYEGRRFQT